MSRIGRSPIPLPQGVDVTVNEQDFAAAATAAFAAVANEQLLTEDGGEDGLLVTALDDLVEGIAIGIEIDD